MIISEEYNEKYNKTLLDKADDLKLALQYYIDRTNQLEQELNYYKKSYENRVEKYYELEQRIYRPDFISKDKIRAKIKSLEEKIHIVIPNEYNKVEIMNEFKNEGAVDILKELLEEE